jgi:ankyrin repeat protein
MPDIQGFDNDGLTALHAACGHREADAAKLLLEHGADVDAACPKSRYQTPLAWAIMISRDSRIELANLFLAKGADVEGRTIHTRDVVKFHTPLHLAIRQPRAELAEILIKHGASLKALDGNGVPTLHLALRARRLDMMNFVVDNGGDINMVNQEGSSALHILASQSYSIFFPQQAVFFFKRRGADMLLVNEAMQTPLQLAVLSGWPDYATRISWGT